MTEPVPLGSGVSQDAVVFDANLDYAVPVVVEESEQSDPEASVPAEPVSDTLLEEDAPPASEPEQAAEPAADEAPSNTDDEK